MADALESGTPPTPDGTDPAQGGGTPASGQDGREPSGKPADPELLRQWELKTSVENVNKVEAARRKAEEERDELRRRLEEAQRATYGQAQPSQYDTLVTNLRQEAAYDPVAAERLMVLETAAMSHREAALSTDMDLLGVPSQYKASVVKVIRESGYRIPLNQAISMVIPPENPEVASRLKSVEEENAKLRAQLNAQQSRPSAGPAWAGGSGGGVARATTTITASEYRAALAEGGTRGATLKADVAANKVRIVGG